MRSIRKFAYAAVLSLSMFTIQPTLAAAAEEAHGSFVLSHEVRCQKVALRPGNYIFSVRTIGPSEVLTLQSLNGGTDAMLLVQETVQSSVQSSKPNDTSKLVLVWREGQSFVSSLELPAYDMSLRFAVPPETRTK